MVRALIDPAATYDSIMFTGRASNNNSDNNPDEPPVATEPPQTITHHPEFFFDNTLVAIQIDNVLFNVHKYQLAKSGVFSDMFKLPKPTDGEPEEGSSPKHPIVIEGVAASDFTALLRVLYASHFSSNQPSPKASLIIPAFRLANMFDFSELRAYLLPLAEKNLDDVDKIVFAREFDIKEWLAPAHTRLCLREDPLSNEEARKLGVDSVLIVWRMREQHRNRTSGGGYTCQGCNNIYGAGYLRCNGPGRITQNRITSATFDNTAIEAGVKKWVEDSCNVIVGSHPTDPGDDGTGGLMGIDI
ncbi:hypothetical protein OPQ81_000393 [Rhizoctonia solani]|nr:hypothetical protein OPQ81_000393 [Rhizoctonia solani]